MGIADAVKSSHKDATLVLNGVKGQTLTTSGDSLKISENNRAFFLKDASEKVELAYKHNYLGGSISFDVDIADVGCGCTAGVYLAAIDEKFNFKDLDEGVTPTCSSIDLMEADIWGLKTQTSACKNGVCSDANMCWTKTSGAKMGPGPSYSINTSAPFNVKVAFWSDADANGKATNLKKVVTSITQGSALYTLTQECTGLKALEEEMQKNNFALGVSTTTHVDGSCLTRRCTAASYKMSNIEFNMNDSLNAYEKPAVPDTLEKTG